MAIAYIGIGSNLGNREENCNKAIDLLIIKRVKVVKRSSQYETEPWGIREQPEFINMAVEAETRLAPEELLDNLKTIEIALGRCENVRWGPRIIDLDILFYDDLIMHTPRMEIPHPGIKDREFVLRPLSEIAPDTIHPVLKKSMKTLMLGLLKSKEKSGG